MREGTTYAMDSERCGDAEKCMQHGIERLKLGDRSENWSGEYLSVEDSMLCLILACCKCDKIPALLLVRPFHAQRRWSVDGEIEFVRPPDNDAVPQWPKKVFNETTEFDGVAAAAHAFVYSATALGVREQISDGTKAFYLAPAFQRQRRQRLFHVNAEEDVLFLEMDEKSKEQIWKQTSADQRLQAWFDLVKLVIYSYPDVHGEVCWQKVLYSCRTVIESTIIPFLSVLDWAQLRSHESM